MQRVASVLQWVEIPIRYPDLGLVFPHPVVEPYRRLPMAVRIGEPTTRARDGRKRADSDPRGMNDDAFSRSSGSLSPLVREGDRTRLERCQAWLETVVPLPRDETGWHQLGAHPVDWLTSLPMGWAPHWRLLSPRERTLTVEALDDLDGQRPGAVAAALPPSRAAASEPTPLWDVSVHWSGCSTPIDTDQQDGTLLASKGLRRDGSFFLLTTWAPRWGSTFGKRT